MLSGVKHDTVLWSLFMYVGQFPPSSVLAYMQYRNMYCLLRLMLSLPFFPNRKWARSISPFAYWMLGCAEKKRERERERETVEVGHKMAM
jgi:hypothetical protein